MNISLKTHKVLWGRSGNLCAFPDCKKELVVGTSETDDISIVGEEAHIVAKEIKGPRGESQLMSERDEYDNLILLCRNHHRVIDDNPTKYPVELLHEYKKKHEDWVKQNLNIDNAKQREDEFYASYIDDFLKFADIENYKAWTSWLLSGGQPKISKEQHDKLRDLVNYIISRVWSNRYPELEKALLNFKNVLNDLLKVFDRYAEYVGNGEQIWTKKFYKIDSLDEQLYEKLGEKYDFHVQLIDDLTLELTRAVNYIFDSVRQYLVPSFRIKEGVLLVESGPFMDMSWRTYRTEYKSEERIEFPYPGLRKFMEIRNCRNISSGTGVSEDYFPTNSE